MNTVTGVSRLLVAAEPHTSSLKVVDPGLFITDGNRAAALNQDLSVNTTATPQPAGALILLFITGQGPLSPALQDGMAAPANPLSMISGNVGVIIGGKQAQVIYAGVAPGFAGLSQINAVIPRRSDSRRSACVRHRKRRVEQRGIDYREVGAM